MREGGGREDLNYSGRNTHGTRGGREGDEIERRRGEVRQCRGGLPGGICIKRKKGNKERGAEWKKSVSQVT